MKAMTKTLAVRVKSHTAAVNKKEQGFYGKKVFANNGDVQDITVVDKGKSFNAMGGEGASRNKIKNRRHDAKKKKSKAKVQNNITMKLYKEIKADRSATIVSNTNEWDYGYKSSDDDDVPTEDDSDEDNKILKGGAGEGLDFSGKREADDGQLVPQELED